MVLERDGRGKGERGVFSYVKANLVVTSQANNFENRGIMLQNRSYSIKSSVELPPFLLESLRPRCLWRGAVSSLVSSGLKCLYSPAIPSRLTQAFTEVAVFEGVFSYLCSSESPSLKVSDTPVFEREDPFSLMLRALQVAFCG